MPGPRLFKVPPGLRVRGLNPGTVQPAMVNAPVRVRQHFGNLPGGMPNGDGSPGNPVWPYTENVQYGDAGGAPLTLPVAVGAADASLTDQQSSMVSTPYGQSDRPWRNPTTYSGFPITVALNAVQGILNMNPQRNSLIIQNTSTATAPDVAPTLYVGFNSQPSLNSGALALPPGLGFYWGAADCPPRDNIFVTFIGGNNGATVVLNGCVIQGTYLPNP